jgi:hypothetical protein
MKVYIGPYRDRWISTIHDRYMKKKYGYNDWPETQTRYENFLEKLEDVLQWIYNHSTNLILDKCFGQKMKIRIDNYDTWSMDHTLAPIILPMLNQLKETNHGAPFVDDEDVPEELRSTNALPKENDYDIDSNHLPRWDWVMDEMIWAFEQKCRDDWMKDYYGPYIEGEDGKPLSGHFECVDRKGAIAHQKRMSNGFRLFGKYFENLWD